MPQVRDTRFIVRVPPEMKERIQEKLRGRSMTYVGQEMLTAWIAGDIKLVSDGDGTGRNARDAKKKFKRVPKSKSCA